MKKLIRKANISAAQAFTMGIAGLAITVAIVLYVLSEMKVSVEQGENPSYKVGSDTITAAGNATGTFITKLGKIPTWVGLLIVVFFAGLVLTYFYMKG